MERHLSQEKQSALSIQQSAGREPSVLELTHIQVTAIAAMTRDPGDSRQPSEYAGNIISSRSMPPGWHFRMTSLQCSWQTQISGLGYEPEKILMDSTIAI